MLSVASALLFLAFEPDIFKLWGPGNWFQAREGLIQSDSSLIEQRIADCARLLHVAGSSYLLNLLRYYCA